MSLLTIISSLNGSAVSGVTQLGTPTLTATVISDTQINLSSTTDVNAVSYKFERSLDGSTGWSVLQNNSSNTYHNTGLTASTHYYYRVTLIGNGTTYSDSAYGTDDDITEATPTLVPYSAGLVNDDGYYNGFLQHSDIINNKGFGIYKKSPSHPSGGPLILIKTTNSGTTHTENNITSNGTEIFSQNHSFIWTSTGRLLVAYTDADGITRIIKSDGLNHVFGSAVYTISPSTNLFPVPSPVPMIETSYGTIIFCVYVVGTSGQPASALLYESSDDGDTWAVKSTIYTSNTPYSGTLPWRGDEFTIVETHPTGNETTSKWLALVRVELPSDSGTYYMVFKSSDGANTWAMDLTSDSGSFVDDNGNTITSGSFSRGLLYRFLSGPSPLHARLINGTVYVANGERNITYGYALKYISATPDNAYQNKFDNWSSPVFVKFYDNYRQIDCGYPILFKDDFDSVFISGYNHSTEAVNTSLADIRCLVETVKIYPLP